MPGRPKVHEDLSRESIARAALRLVDRDGADALSLRRVAAELSTGTATLYHYVRGRPEIVRDVVGLLLAEVDTEARPEEAWDDSVRRTARSLREMALRHPRAFVLVAMVPADEPPLVDYTQRIQEMHAHQDVPAAAFEHMWSVLDAFLTGFLFLQASALSRKPEAAAGRPVVSADDVLSEASFEHDLDIVIRGIAAVEGIPGG